MFLLPIIVPIYVHGSRRLVTTEWRRSLELLRDSLPAELGRITVAAPFHAVASDSSGSQALQPVDGVDLVPLIPVPKRSREYRRDTRSRWLAGLEPLVARAAVVQSGLDDMHQPMMFDALKLSFERDKPTVFVQDTDIVVQARELAAQKPLHSRLRALFYTRKYERTARACVARASLSLLKGKSLMRRYGAFARNAHEFHDTSYVEAEMAPAARVDARVQSIATGRPVRLVYCGRLVARKGLALGLEILARARERGAAVEFDVIGDGEERARLESDVARLRLGDAVRFLGHAAYGAELIERLAQYDALYFTPAAEDTPRMIFDGYAAGLPLVGTDIEYVRERASEEHATCVLPRQDSNRAAEQLCALVRDHARLAELSRAAYAAGRYHAADHWYRRRAEWVRAIVAERVAA
ncbi:MAG: glycosyltransferase [Planctomycetota bacterium]